MDWRGAESPSAIKPSAEVEASREAPPPRSIEVVQGKLARQKTWVFGAAPRAGLESEPREFTDEARTAAGVDSHFQVTLLWKKHPSPTKPGTPSPRPEPTT